MTTVLRFVRTYRRDPGSAASRTPGPWHIDNDHDQTWCGKRPGRMLSSQHARVEVDGPVRSIAGLEGVPVGRYCRPCQHALRPDQPRAYGR